jgi:hypothetical protein
MRGIVFRAVSLSRGGIAIQSRRNRFPICAVVRLVKGCRCCVHSPKYRKSVAEKTHNVEIMSRFGVKLAIRRQRVRV